MQFLILRTFLSPLSLSRINLHHQLHPLPILILTLILLPGISSSLISINHQHLRLPGIVIASSNQGFRLGDPNQYQTRHQNPSHISKNRQPWSLTMPSTYPAPKLLNVQLHIFQGDLLTPKLSQFFTIYSASVFRFSLVADFIERGWLNVRKQLKSAVEVLAWH